MNKQQRFQKITHSIGSSRRLQIILRSSTRLRRLDASEQNLRRIRRNRRNNRIVQKRALIPQSPQLRMQFPDVQTKHQLLLLLLATLDENGLASYDIGIRVRMQT